MIKELHVKECHPTDKTWGNENKPIFEVLVDAGKGEFWATAFSEWKPGKAWAEIVSKEYQGQTQYSLKKAKDPNSNYSGGNKGYSGKDQEAIARSVALKASVDFWKGDENSSADHVVETANRFLGWLKGEDAPEQPRTTQSPPMPSEAPPEQPNIPSEPPF